MSQPRTGTAGDVEEIHWPSLIAAISSITAVGIAIGLGLPLLSIILEKRGISSTLIGLNTAMAGLASMAAAADHDEDSPTNTASPRRCSGRWSLRRSARSASTTSRISGCGFRCASSSTARSPCCSSSPSSGSTRTAATEAAGLRARHLRDRAVARLCGRPAALLHSRQRGHPAVRLSAPSRILLAAIPIFLARNESPVLDEKPELHFMRYVFLVPTATAAVFIFGAVEAGGLSLFPIYAIRAAASPNRRRRCF